MLGLLELCFVVALGLAWGVHELRTMRRDRRTAQAERPPDPPPPSP